LPYLLCLASGDAGVVDQAVQRLVDGGHQAAGGGVRLLELHHVHGLVVEVHAGDALPLAVQGHQGGVGIVQGDVGDPGVLGLHAHHVAEHIVEGAGENDLAHGLGVGVLGVVHQGLVDEGDHVVDVDVLGGVVHAAVGVLVVGEQHLELGHHMDLPGAPAVGDVDVQGGDAGGVVAVVAVAEQGAAALGFDGAVVLQPRVHVRLRISLLVQDGIALFVLEDKAVIDQVLRLEIGQAIILADGGVNAVRTGQLQLLAISVDIVPILVDKEALVQLVIVLGDLLGQQVKGLLVVGDAPLGFGVGVEEHVLLGGELALLGEHFPLGLEGTGGGRCRPGRPPGCAPS